MISHELIDCSTTLIINLTNTKFHVTDEVQFIRFLFRTFELCINFLIIHEVNTCHIIACDFVHHLVYCFTLSYNTIGRQIEIRSITNHFTNAIECIRIVKAVAVPSRYNVRIVSVLPKFNKSS